MDIQKGYWNSVNNSVTILSTTEGSGGYLTYDVFGIQNGKKVHYLHRENLFQGLVFLKEGKLIEADGGKYYEWIVMNGQLLRVPYQLPIIPDALVIYYKILPDKTVLIAKDAYSVPVGTTIQLIRTDVSSIPVRILFGNGPLKTEYMPDSSAFKVLEAGRQEVIIIPDGYDWDKAKTIIIDIKK